MITVMCTIYTSHIFLSIHCYINSCNNVIIPDTNKNPRKTGGNQTLVTRMSANSCRPLDCLQYVFALCDPVTSDLILNGQPGLMMDYPHGKFDECSFSRFDSITQTNIQMHIVHCTHTHTNVDQHSTPATQATVIGMSNNRS